MEQEEKWAETCFPMKQISWQWFIKLLGCILIRPFSSSHLSRCTVEHSKCYIHPSCQREVVSEMRWPLTLTSETHYCISHLCSFSPLQQRNAFCLFSLTFPMHLWLRTELENTPASLSHRCSNILPSPHYPHSHFVSTAVVIYQISCNLLVGLVMGASLRG